MAGPRTVRERCRAKLNLFLDVTGRRADGFHELVTVFHEIDLADDLVVTAGGGAPGALSFAVDPPALDVSNDTSNLALRAAGLLWSRSGAEVALSVTLTIPVIVASVAQVMNEAVLVPPAIPFMGDLMSEVGWAAFAWGSVMAALLVSLVIQPQAVEIKLVVSLGLIGWMLPAFWFEPARAVGKNRLAGEGNMRFVYIEEEPQDKENNGSGP